MGSVPQKKAVTSLHPLMWRVLYFNVFLLENVFDFLVKNRYCLSMILFFLIILSDIVSVFSSTRIVWIKSVQKLYTLCSSRAIIRRNKIFVYYVPFKLLRISADLKIRNFSFQHLKYSIIFNYSARGSKIFGNLKVYFDVVI